MDEEGNRRVKLFELYEANPELFKSAPKATVICLTYNHEAYLDKAIQSILDQEVDFPIEIILHDDASTDRSIEILLRYKEKFPNLFKLHFETENQFSLGRAGFFIQNLLDQAAGDYIFWLETDDFWIGKKKIKFTCNFLDSNKNYSSAFHDYQIGNKTNNVIKKNCLPDAMRADVSEERLQNLSYSFILMGAFCFRNVKLKLPQEFYLTISGDMFYPMLMANYGPCKYLKGSFNLYYRQTETGIWAGKDQISKDKSKLIFAIVITMYFIKTRDSFAVQNQIFTRLIPSLIKYLLGQPIKFFPFEKYFK